MSRIPVSAIIVTRNEEERIGRCIEALGEFGEVLVVDSNSTDRTKAVAEAAGAKVENFVWNGQYPKKRQWCLDTLALQYDWVFFIDADEIATPELVAEIAALDFAAPGYFIRGRYVFDGRLLRHGLTNNKLCLIDRRRMEFPVVDDLDLPGMGEIEGHYQPVLKGGLSWKDLGKSEKPRQLKHYILHNAFQGGEAVWDQPGVAAGEGVWSENVPGEVVGTLKKDAEAGLDEESGLSGWEIRHRRYAAWERGMNARKAWPEDARLAKRVFKALPCQGLVAFLHSYILKMGFLDGAYGLKFALSRWRYYRMI